jgi:hypothetical protein
MADLSTLQAAIERLRPVVDALDTGQAAAAEALAELACLVAVEARRHPPKLSDAEKLAERTLVERKLADYQRLTPGASPTAARSWICRRTGIPLRRVRARLAEIRAIRATGPDSGQHSPASTTEGSSANHG